MTPEMVTESTLRYKWKKYDLKLLSLCLFSDNLLWDKGVFIVISNPVCIVSLQVIDFKKSEHIVDILLFTP